MALTNCKKISDVSITVSKDQSLGSTDAVMFIDPIDGNYVVSAANFQNNTSGLSAYINTSNNLDGFVNGIKLSDTTAPYASDNRIRVDIDLLDAFSPSANVELEIDIDGSATHVDDIVFSISGSYATVTSGGITVTPSDSSYNATGKFGQKTELFTLTFTAQTDKFFEEEPNYIISNAGEFINNYIFTAFDRVYTNGNLTSIKIKVEWQFLKQNLTGHKIKFYPYVIEESDPLFVIDNFTMDTSTIPQNGSVRNISITGTPGASFVFSITDGSSDTYNFADDIFDNTSTNLSGVLNQFGKFEQENIQFPASESKEKYQLSLQGGTAPASVTSVNGVENNDAFTWTIQAAELISILIGTESNTVSSLISSVQITNGSLIGERGKVYDDEIDTNLAPVDISIVINGSANLFLRKTPEFSTENGGDFSNTDPNENGGTLFSINNIQTSGDGTNQITISGKFSVNEVGSENVFSNLNLDNIINRAPSVNSTQSFTGQQGSEKIITLTGTDPENDPISFKITQDVTFGELYEETDVDLTSPISAPYSLGGEGANKVRFKHDNSSNLSPVFKYKANDGFQDSNTECTVTGTLAATNNPPTADSQNATVNEFHYVAITLTGSDPEGETPIFKITSLPANGTLYKAIVFYNESTSEDPYGLNGVPHYYYNRQNNNTLYIQNANTTLGGQYGNNRLSSNTVIFGYSPSPSSGYTSTTFGFKTSDGVNESSEATVTVSRNRAPVGTKLTETIDQGKTKTITLTATDAENDSVDFYISSPLPSKGSLEDANGYRIKNFALPYLLPSANVVYKNNSNLSPGEEETDTIKYYPIDEHNAQGTAKALNITIDGPGFGIDYKGTIEMNRFDAGNESSWVEVRPKDHSAGVENYQNQQTSSSTGSNVTSVTGYSDLTGSTGYHNSIPQSSANHYNTGRLRVSDRGAVFCISHRFENIDGGTAYSDNVRKRNSSWKYIDFRIFNTLEEKTAFINKAYEILHVINGTNPETGRVGNSITNEVVRLTNHSTNALDGYEKFLHETSSNNSAFENMTADVYYDSSDHTYRCVVNDLSNKEGAYCKYGLRAPIALAKLEPGEYYYACVSAVWINEVPGLGGGVYGTLSFNRVPSWMADTQYTSNCGYSPNQVNACAKAAAEDLWG